MRSARRLAVALVGVALLVPAGTARAASAPDGPLAETEDVAALLGVDPAAGIKASVGRTVASRPARPTTRAAGAGS